MTREPKESLMRFAKMLVLVTLVACPLPGATHAAQPSADAKPPFALAISAVPNTVRAGSAAVVEIVLTNVSGQPIQLKSTPGPGYFAYKMSIRSDQGRMLPARPLAWKDREGRFRISFPSSIRTVTLGPGKTLKDRYPLDWRFDLDTPGAYTIQASRYDYETKTWVKSNTITITVTAK
jgi:hypothetical protein